MEVASTEQKIDQAVVKNMKIKLLTWELPCAPELAVGSSVMLC